MKRVQTDTHTHVIAKIKLKMMLLILLVENVVSVPFCNIFCGFRIYFSLFGGLAQDALMNFLKNCVLIRFVGIVFVHKQAACGECKNQTLFHLISIRLRPPDLLLPANMAKELMEEWNVYAKHKLESEHRDTQPHRETYTRTDTKNKNKNAPIQSKVKTYSRLSP